MESVKLEELRKNGAFSARQAGIKPDEEARGVSPAMSPCTDAYMAYRWKFFPLVCLSGASLEDR